MLSHIQAMFIDFGLAKERNGHCYLRYEGILIDLGCLLFFHKYLQTFLLIVLFSFMHFYIEKHADMISVQQVWWYKSRGREERIHRPYSRNCHMDGLGTLQSYIYKWLFPRFIWTCYLFDTEGTSLCRSPGLLSLGVLVWIKEARISRIGVFW